MTAASSAVRLPSMRPRDPAEPHRTASPLELFFDLVFVVAVSVAAIELHHALSEHHVADGVLSYVIVFFGIWWAWMNFTWFATSFDTDDWLYRVMTFVQMGGVLVLAAGIHPAFAERDFTLLIMGYLVMRLALVAQWLRASGAPSHRATARTYAGGIAALQVLWCLSLLLPEAAVLPVVGVLIVAELAVPVVAERRRQTPWHPHHITERYGLFTLILLGESLLASANAFLEAREEGSAHLGELVLLAVITLVVTCCLWWIYFWPHHAEAIGGIGQSLRYGYTHYFVFAAAGAFSAGVEAQIDVLTDHSELATWEAQLTVSVPIAVFVLGVWWIAMRSQCDPVTNLVVPAAGVLVLLDVLVPFPMATSVVALVVVVVVLARHEPVVRRPDADSADPAAQVQA